MNDPPQNIEAEQHVLGAMMVAPIAVERVIHHVQLTAGEFYRVQHGTIYEAITSLAREQSPVDALTVSESLQRHGTLEGVGGRDAVAALAATTATPGNAAHYADIVKQNAVLRRLVGTAQTIQQAVGEGSDQTPKALVAKATELLAELSNAITESPGPVEPEELRDYFFDYLNAPDPIDVFKLPWSRLNSLCGGGFIRRQLNVVTGPTSEGKSSVVDQMLDAFHRDGYRCGIHGTEMSKEERMARWLSKECNVPFHRILHKRMDAAESKKVVARLNAGPPPWSFRDAEGWHVERIAQDVIARKLDVVVIDPINLIKGANETKTMDLIADRLKQLANEGNCCVIAVAHLNRLNMGRDGKMRRPSLGDIRQSGMIEANAANIMVLYRHRDEDNTITAEGELGFIKARNGIRDRFIDVRLVPGRYEFKALSDKEPPPEQAALEVPGGGKPVPKPMTSTQALSDPEPSDPFD